MQNRNTNTGNQLKDALNEVLNLYDNIKEKNPETKNSIYKYYGEEKCIKKGMLENKIPMGFHRKNMSISFAKYLDDSYLFPRSNQLWALIKILVIYAVIFFFICLILSYDNVLAITISCVVTSPIIIYFIYIIISMEVFIRKKKSTFYSALRKIKFNKENKEELRSLMKDDEMLWEIFQVKYGKDRILFIFFFGYHYYVSEDGTFLSPSGRADFKAIFIIHIFLSLCFDGSCIYAIIFDDNFINILIVLLVFTGFLNLVIIQWILLFTITMKKYKFKEIPKEKPKSKLS